MCPSPSCRRGTSWAFTRLKGAVAKWRWSRSGSVSSPPAARLRSQTSNQTHPRALQTLDSSLSAAFPAAASKHRGDPLVSFQHTTLSSSCRPALTERASMSALFCWLCWGVRRKNSDLSPWEKTGSERLHAGSLCSSTDVSLRRSLNVHLPLTLRSDTTDTDSELCAPVWSHTASFCLLVFNCCIRAAAADMKQLITNTSMVKWWVHNLC